MNDQISRQKLIEKYHRNIVHGCNPIDCKKAESLSENCLACAMRRTRELIESQPPADQWIPCSSGRLPTHNTFFPQKVFVTYVEDSARYTAKAWLNMDGKWANLSNGEYFDEGSVVAWMPLPEPYKGE